MFSRKGTVASIAVSQPPKIPLTSNDMILPPLPTSDEDGNPKIETRRCQASLRPGTVLKEE
jgi:hypothetical protein